MIRKLGEQAGLDDTGVLLYESMLMKENPRGNPAAVSPKGAVGLAQLMPGTAKMLRVKDPTDPRQNLLGGARHLKEHARPLRRRPVLAAAAYNAGEGYVKTMVPRFAETIAYVRSVFKNFLALGGNPVDVEHYIPPPKPRRRARKPAKPDSMQAVAPH